MLNFLNKAYNLIYSSIDYIINNYKVFLVSLAFMIVFNAVWLIVEHFSLKKLKNIKLKNQILKTLVLIQVYYTATLSIFLSSLIFGVDIPKYQMFIDSAIVLVVVGVLWVVIDIIFITIISIIINIIKSSTTNKHIKKEIKKQSKQTKYVTPEIEEDVKTFTSKWLTKMMKQTNLGRYEVFTKYRDLYITEFYIAFEHKNKDTAKLAVQFYNYFLETLK